MTSSGTAMASCGRAVEGSGAAWIDSPWQTPEADLRSTEARQGGNKTLRSVFVECWPGSSRLSSARFPLPLALSGLVRWV